MAEIKQTLRASRVLNKAYEWCKEYRHEFIMPEHLLLALLEEFNFNAAVNIFYRLCAGICLNGLLSPRHAERSV